MSPKGIQFLFKQGICPMLVFCTQMFHFYGNNNIWCSTSLALKPLKKKEGQKEGDTCDHLFIISNSHLKCSVPCN